MKLTSYRQILEMGKQAVEKALIPVRIMQARKQGELEMMKIEEQTITLESKITELCTVYPIDYNRIIEKLDEHALLLRRKEQFAKIIAELFDDTDNG